MKKMFSMLLSVLLVFSMLSSVSAETLNENTSAGETSIEYSVGETYTVVIPEEIVVAKDTETPVEYDVVVKDLLIPYNNILTVSVEYEGKLKLFEHSATTLGYQIIKSSDSSVLSNGSEVMSVPAGTVEEQSETLTAVLTETPIIAGNYEDTATFKISVGIDDSAFGEAIQMWEISETKGVDDVWMVYYQPEMETVPTTYNLRSGSGTTTQLYENGTVYIKGAGRMEEGIFNYFYDFDAVYNDVVETMEEYCEENYPNHEYRIELQNGVDTVGELLDQGVYMWVYNPTTGNVKASFSNNSIGYTIDTTNTELVKFVPTDVVIDEGVTNVSESAFSSTSITTVNLPSTITEISATAFQKCDGLTEVIIPDNVTSIGYSAFKECTNLTSVVLPRSLISMGLYAFESCTNLNNISFNNTIEKWNSVKLETRAPNGSQDIYNYWARGTQVTKVICTDGKLGLCNWCGRTVSSHLSFELNEDGKSYSISSIEDSSCNTTLIIPSSYNGSPVTSIGASAVPYIIGSSVAIPASVTSVGDGAFKKLASGTTIYCETQAVADLLIAGTHYTANNTTVVVDASKFA